MTRLCLPTTLYLLAIIGPFGSIAGPFRSIPPKLRYGC